MYVCLRAECAVFVGGRQGGDEGISCDEDIVRDVIIDYFKTIINNDIILTSLHTLTNLD